MELVEVIMVDCPRCGQRKPAHHIDKHICIDCSHAESNRMTYYRQHQGDWIAEAKEQGIPVWLQQPGETSGSIPCGWRTGTATLARSHRTAASLSSCRQATQQ